MGSWAQSRLPTSPPSSHTFDFDGTDGIPKSDQLHLQHVKVDKWSWADSCINFIFISIDIHLLDIYLLGIYIYINALSFTLTLVDDLFRCFRAWPPWPPLKVLAANPKGVGPWRRSAMTSEIGGSLLAALGVVWHWDSLRISMDRMYM